MTQQALKGSSSSCQNVQILTFDFLKKKRWGLCLKSLYYPFRTPHVSSLWHSWLSLCLYVLICTYTGEWINDEDDDDDEVNTQRTVVQLFTVATNIALLYTQMSELTKHGWAAGGEMIPGAWTRGHDPDPPPRTMPRLEGGLSRDLRRWRFSRTVTERDWKLLYWQSIANDLVAVICHFTPRNTSMSGYKGHERLCSVIDWMPASHSPCKLIGLGRITTKDLKMGCGWSLQ